MITTSVVVVAFRSCADLRCGLPVLLADPSVGSVVVVDNSSDEATARLVAAAGRVRYVDPGRNLGFARACNIGMRATEDPVVTFLNPDVLLVRSLRELVESCAADERQLLAGGLRSGAAGTHLGNARRPVTFAGELRRCLLGSRASHLPVPGGTARIPVPQVDGAFVVGSRAFLEDLGGFDERFELYFEDVDLCDRARARGRVVMDTDLWGRHAGGRSSSTVAAVSYTVFRVSRIRYFTKRAGTTGACAALGLTALEALVRSLGRQPEGLRVRLRALALATREVLRPGTVRVLS